jgi:curved DNA-binding protein CbpA
MGKIGWVLLLLTFALLFAETLAKIPDPYKVLGIPRDASEDQVKEGFKRRSKKYHPDRNKVDPRAKEKFEKIVNAY